VLGAVVLPFSSVNQLLGWWPFGRVWCSAWLAIDVWVCTASILNLGAISLDRYLAISRPVTYPLLMSPTRAKVAVAVVWTLALAICLPPLFGWRDADVADTTADRPCDLDRSARNVADRLESRSVPRSCVQGGTGADHSDEYSDRSNARRWTADPVATLQRANLTLGSIYRRDVTNGALVSERFVRHAATASIVDVATHAAARNTSRIRRSGLPRAETNSAASPNPTVVVDASPTTASFAACRAASTSARPICMLTSEPGYIVYSACGSFWIPMIVMMFFYVKIYRTAVKATTALNSGVLTKKTGGRFAASSDVAAVNLRVHRGGGGGAAARTTARSVIVLWSSLFVQLILYMFIAVSTTDCNCLLSATGLPSHRTHYLEQSSARCNLCSVFSDLQSASGNIFILSFSPTLLLITPSLRPTLSGPCNGIITLAVCPLQKVMIDRLIELEVKLKILIPVRLCES